MKKTIIFILIMFSLVSCDTVSELLGIRTPKVKKISPSNNSSNIDPDSLITITFSDEMDRIQTNNAIKLYGTDGEVEVYYTWNKSSTKVVLFPKTGLYSSNKYTVNIDEAAEDIEGNNIDRDYAISFYTNNDLTKPEVLSVTPQNGILVTDSVFIQNPSIVIEFNEAVDLDTIYSGIQISPSIESSYTWNALENIITIVPIYPLQFGTVYTVSVTTSIKDKNNNSLKEAVTSRFTVGDDFLNPSITSVTQPASSVTLLEHTINNYIIKNKTLEIDFSEPVDRQSVLENLMISPAADKYITFENSDTRAVINFRTELESDTVYTLDISQSITDIQKNTLNRDYIYKFKTNNALSTAPEVISIYDKHLNAGSGRDWIQSDLENISPDANKDYTEIQINFSQPMNPHTVLLTIESIMGASSSNTRIANPSWNATFTTLTVDILNLAGSLTDPSTYRLSVKGGETTGSYDQNDNYMKEDYVQIITTYLP